MAFREAIERESRRRRSRIVLALDEVLADRSQTISRAGELIRSTAPHICAVKINRQLVLQSGLHDGVAKLVAIAKDLGLPAIMDAKINDVGHTNQLIAEQYFSAGFDALIASTFIGWREGLEPVFQLARRQGKGVILLVYMSHKGAREGYGQVVIDPRSGKRAFQYELFARKALSWRAEGAVVGATYPRILSRVRRIVKGTVPIYSPGIGPQGGAIQQSVIAGASYLIVGRSIYSSEDPGKAAQQLSKISPPE